MAKINLPKLKILAAAGRDLLLVLHGGRPKVKRCGSTGSAYHLNAPRAAWHLLSKDAQGAPAVVEP